MAFLVGFLQAYRYLLYFELCYILTMCQIENESVGPGEGKIEGKMALLVGKIKYVLSLQ